ncbi:hypothetical protein [Saccharothrix obliqua]|uniref:hypothetical protein n=1 Tax=Saccharothrix obliqua TaxID=2861747 RepID=UPI001C5D4DC3|nr:hypothetical protein [Saccharothrix obliqua]MBW4722347.1 hypothetical protein [Saccharothrix obliqua]
MRKTMKIAAVVTAAAASTVLIGGTAAAQSAAAPPWWDNPATCANPSTAVERTVDGRIVQVRQGNCGGIQYGWGRILNYQAQDLIRFEVDLNGDRVADDFSTYTAGNRNYTKAYPSSPSPNRAFRACYVAASNGTCTDGNSTPWW